LILETQSLLSFLFLSSIVSGSAQTSAQLHKCQNLVDKNIDADLVPGICSTIYKHLSRGERLMRISHDGDFATQSHRQTEERWTPARLQSTVLLDTMGMYYKELERLARKLPQMSIYATPEEADFILNL
jgi:hypothetical protein